jgi:hypothetical protein
VLLLFTILRDAIHIEAARCRPALTRDRLCTAKPGQHDGIQHADSASSGDIVFGAWLLPLNALSSALLINFLVLLGHSPRSMRGYSGAELGAASRENAEQRLDM